MSTSSSVPSPRLASDTSARASDRSAVFVYAATIGLFAGVAAELLSGVGGGLAVLAAAISVTLLFLLRNKKAALLVFVFCACLSLGVLRAEYAERALAVPSSAFGYHTTLEGTVIRDPEQRETSVRAAVRISAPQEVAGVVLLVLLDRGEEVSFGDMLTLRGEVEAPERFETDSGRQFDYPSYLKAKGISAVMHRPVVLLREEGGFSIRGALYAGKRAFERSIDRAFFEPPGGFLKGILLGIDALPEDVQDDFIAVGIIHIVVLSGYNITLVAEAFMRFLAWVKARPAVGYASAALAVVLFVIMTGAEETAVRAGIMALLLIVARALRRPGDMLRALALAGFAMIAWNPHALLGSPSFALSFLATMGLILLAPITEPRLARVPAIFGLREILAATLAAQIAVLPYILWMSGVVSPYSILVNLIVLPLMPLAMFVGFAAAVLGFIHFYLALLPALIVSAVLSFVVWFAHVAAALPGAFFTVQAFPWWGSVLLYALLCTGLLYAKRKTASPRLAVQKTIATTARR